MLYCQWKSDYYNLSEGEYQQNPFWNPIKDHLEHALKLFTLLNTDQNCSNSAWNSEPRADSPYLPGNTLWNSVLPLIIRPIYGMELETLAQK